MADPDPDHDINNNNNNNTIDIDNDNDTVPLGTPTQPIRTRTATAAATTTTMKANIATVGDDTTVWKSNDNDNEEGATRTRTTTTKNKNYEDENDNEDEDANELYEPADIAWCRRRPTWRKRKGAAAAENDHDHEDSSSDDTSIYETCSNLFHYYPAVDILTKGQHPYLASFWNETYTFTNDESFRDNTYLEKERRRHHHTYQTLPILERPFFQQLIHCMDQEVLQLQQEDQQLPQEKLPLLLQLWLF